MKTILSILALTFSLAAAAEDSACAALIKEFNIPARNKAEEGIRKIAIEGKSKDEKICQMKFLPDYCSFELGAPLAKAEMYHLRDTSYSTVKMTVSTSKRFIFKAVTKESTDDWGQVTKILRFDKEENGEYLLKYEMKEGRFFKNDAKSFKCTVNVVR